MRCPNCGSLDTQVRDSRPTEDSSAIRRRRVCLACNFRFTTFERVQLRELIVIKRVATDVDGEVLVWAPEGRAGRPEPVALLLLRTLLSDYPDTDATAQALYVFAETYARRKEPDGATLALATLAHHHPEGPLAAEARRRLGTELSALDGDDPLPRLVQRLDELQGRADRQQLPRSVSAYPDNGPATPSPY